MNTLKNNKIINIIYNNNPPSIKTFNELKNKLIDKGYIITDTYDNNAMLNICIGGDGAFLRTVHDYNFPNIPFVGINTGHLGFIQQIDKEDIDSFVNNLYNGKYSIDSLYLVEAIVCTRTSCIELIGVNEIVVKGIDSKVIHLNISIDNNYLERFSGDGVLVSTPMGSTAYNFSTGGSIVYPTLGVMQLTPIAPINSKVYRSLTTSVIVPHNMKIKLHPEYRDENSILIVLDGEQHKYDNITEIDFQISKMKINVLNIGNNNFWSNIREKFL